MIVGQDTDSESNLLEAAMPWIVKNDKPFDWVGKWATQQVAERGLRWMLVGFESPTGAIPVEGGQVVVDGRSSGPRHVGAPLGGARQGDRARDRAARARRRRRPIRRPGRGKRVPMTRASRAVLRPRRRAAQGMSDVARLPLARRSPATRARSIRSRARRRSRCSAAAGATFEERDGWRVAASIPDEASRLARGRHRRPLPPREARRARPRRPRQRTRACDTVLQASSYRLSPRRALVFFPETARSR